MSGYAAFEKKGDVKPFAYNPPKLADDFVEVKITCCGICGSDIHTIDSGWGPSNYPVIPGHEIIGTATAVGSAVKHVKVGDRVGIGAQCGACLDCYECKEGAQNHCSRKLIWTYNTKYPDGQVSQGGYADRVRCQADFAFLIPESISSEEAAPLMCAGVTVFAPLARSLTRKGMKVGIIGVGGLGHLGVMFASKLLDGSAEVTAISHNSKKKDDALKMGAKHFLDTSNQEQLKAAARSFDYVLCTANGKQQDYNAWLSTIKLSVTTRHSHADGRHTARGSAAAVVNEASMRSAITFPVSRGSLLVACACFFICLSPLLFLVVQRRHVLHRGPA
jgi:alcohol dehydrogenase (NADP+)